MKFNVIDDKREMLVDFYVSDMSRDIANVGLAFYEAEALRLAIKYERENGRTEAGDGFVRATSRMLDNAFGADEGPHELGKFLVADLALQRHAADVIRAGDAFKEHGTEPAGFDEALVKYVIKEDLHSDPDVASDWKALAEGRFHDATPMVHDLIREDVMQAAHLPEDVGEWMYAQMQTEEPEWQPSRTAQAITEEWEQEQREELGVQAEQSLGAAFQEHVAGEPGHGFLSDEEQSLHADRWFAEQRGALGLPPASEYAPFPEPTPDMAYHARTEVAEALSRITHNDDTISADSALERAIRYLGDKGLPLNEERIAQVEKAWMRAATRGTGLEIFSPNDQARMMIFDVATQQEARAMLLGAEGKPAHAEAMARPARALIDSLGIRRLDQEKPSDQDLKHIASGDWGKVSEYHRAGLDLGLHWAGHNEKATAMDRRMEELTLGVRREPAPVRLADQARDLRSEPVRAKGPQSIGDALAAAFAQQEASRAAGR